MAVSGALVIGLRIWGPRGGAPRGGELGDNLEGGREVLWVRVCCAFRRSMLLFSRGQQGGGGGGGLRLVYAHWMKMMKKSRLVLGLVDCPRVC